MGPGLVHLASVDASSTSSGLTPSALIISRSSSHSFQTASCMTQPVMPSSPGGKAVLIAKGGASVKDIDDNKANPLDELSHQLEELLADSAERDKETKLRTINQGEVLLKITGLLCLEKLPKDKLSHLLGPIQLGVAVRGGTEIAIRRLQSYLELEGADSDTIILFLDIANAFMTANRAKMLSAVFSFPELQPIWRLVRWHLGSPNPRYLDLDDGSTFSFFQSDGGPQGDVLMPLMFSALIHTLHSRVTASRPCMPAAYLDDTAIGAKVEVGRAVYEDMVKLCPSLVGSTINASKTIVLTPTNRPSQAVLDFVKTYGLQLHTSCTQYVGGVVGTDTNRMEEFIVGKVQAHKEVFSILGHPDMPKQVAVYYARLALAPTMNHLLRAHPTSITMKGARLWDDAMQQLMIDITESEDLLLPQNHLALAQMSLPTRYGGTGIVPAQSVAHIASISALATSATDIASFLRPTSQKCPLQALKPRTAPDNDSDTDLEDYDAPCSSSSHSSSS